MRISKIMSSQRANKGWIEDDYEMSDSFRSMGIVAPDRFDQPAGFVRLKETNVTNKQMTPEEVENLRIAADLQSVLPSITTEIDAMTRSVMNRVYIAIGKGELTPEEAMSYWMEMYSYHRLAGRLNTRAEMANQVVTTRRQ
jgi:hypothetical protein